MAFLSFGNKNQLFFRMEAGGLATNQQLNFFVVNVRTIYIDRNKNKNKKKKLTNHREWNIIRDYSYNLRALLNALFLWCIAILS